MKLEFDLAEDPKIKSQITMIAAHSIQHSDKLNSHLPEIDDSEGFLYLYLYRISHQLFGKNGLEENRSICLQ